MTCQICGTVKNLDRHHVIPKRMGGSRNAVVHDESNLMTLCRSCHGNLHDGRWRLERDSKGLRVFDVRTSKQIMRRLSPTDGTPDAPFQVFNLDAAGFDTLIEQLPHFTDD